MKVGIYTLGCKVNTYESEFVLSLLKNHGYEIASFDDICDVYILNTCTVTNTSDIKSRKMIHQAKRRNPKACVVAMGCFIEANPSYRDEAIDIAIGTQNKSQILSYLDAFWKERTFQDRIKRSAPGTFEDMEVKEFYGRSRAFVKIQDGCENFCSYCIIPMVRGKCRSKPFDRVVQEVEGLVEKGYKEIVLTGIHTGNYGVDLGTDFAHLLRRLASIPHLFRLRISSIEITELTDAVLDVLREFPVIVDHLHIPLQSGSDAVLKQMRRKYDCAYFKHKVEEIRAIRPDIALTTDVIVGFPGETEEDFQQTLTFIRKLQLAKVHVFPYSRRKGTKADEMEGQIPDATKKNRAQRLIRLSHELEQAYQEKWIGKVLDVLIETTDGKTSEGHTSNYLKVKVKGKYPSEEVLPVMVTSCDGNICYGEVAVLQETK